MKANRIVITTVALAVIVVTILAGAGWWLLSRSIWYGVTEARGAGGQGWSGWGPMGMMSGYFGAGDASDESDSVPGWGLSNMRTTIAGQILTIDQAKDVVENYVARLGYGDLEVYEVMEFARNFYAIVKEKDTGIGAMELLVDKNRGAVGPEYGPNMMWNAKYVMHRGGMVWMMGGDVSESMTISPAQALNIAQRWLEVYRPGMVVESHADAFYGYYTIHALRDGEICGMLSVHGDTGQVWYHNWHGDFVQMIGEEEA